MASKIVVKTSFEPVSTIEPIYTGGDVAADASGRWLATCIDDDVLIVDLQTTQPVVRVEGDGEPVTSLCLSPTGRHLVVCSRSLSLRIYSLILADGHGSATATLERTLKPHATPVIVTSIDDTGALLATGGADSSVKVWDVQGGYSTHTFHGHSGVVSSLCFFRYNVSITKPNGKRKSRDAVNGYSTARSIYLASGGEDGHIRVWDLFGKKSVANLDAHQSTVRSLDFSAVQGTLLSVSRDQTLILWNLSKFEIKRVIATREVLETAGFILGGSYCFAGGEHGNIRIWSCETGREVTQSKRSETEGDAIVSIVPTHANEELISIHQDQTLRFFSVAELKSLEADSITATLPLVRRISGNHDEIIDMACIGPNKSLLALATNSESIRIISVVDSTSKENAQTSMESSPSNAFGSDVALLEGHKDIVICLDADWSGCWLATGSKDNTARLWRVGPEKSSYACIALLQGHAESLGAIALPKAPSRSNAAATTNPLQYPPEYLLTGSQDRTIKKWDTATLSLSPEYFPHAQVKASFTRVAHEKDINAIDISTTSALFASASQDRTIKIWSLEDGSVVGILRGHKRGVWSIQFSPTSASPLTPADGGTGGSRGLLVSGSGDRTVKVWSLSTFTCLLTFEGHSNSVLKVIWLPPVSESQDDDRPQSHSSPQNHPIIASASSDTLIKLWDPYAQPTSDHLLTTLDNHTDRVWALAVPIDLNKSSNPPNPSTQPTPSTSLISGAADGRLTFWTDTTAQTLQRALATASRRVEQDQQLQNQIAAKNYHEVIILALTLNHPGRLLKLFQDLLTLPLEERDEGTLTGKKEVDDVIGSLSHSQLYLLLQRVRDWNTNARTAPVAQRVLNVILKAYPPRTFEEMARSQRKLVPGNADAVPSGAVGSVRGGQQSMVDLMRALEVYTERHYRRTEELEDESWILEYTLREMDEVAGSTGLGSNGTEVDGEVMEERNAAEGLGKKVNGVKDRKEGEIDEAEDVDMT